MGFTRNWDASCPRVWKEFEAGGRKYVVQDLAPEDDGRALEILVGHMCTDEVLCNLSNLSDDAESVEGIKAFWAKCLEQRMSLGCYTDIDGKHTLVALNVCVVDTVDERTPYVEIVGEAWKNVYKAIEIMEERCDVFKYLGLDTVLHALGLIVSREFRGMGLGSYILDSREPLSKALGIKATATVFTGPASQKSAEKVGFTTIYTMSLKDFVDAGLKYPNDENKLVKLMVKKYSH
ncbi:uncharacterized protein LOC121729394 [Aricia agestis]|uniref:uncharacterized protein LOC121729394 n=1 Tax=Aricia agestis TaxID=91739 RepID=UPI001C208A99|nr:uncharacterized protein LOC121729394 [Aricia agestis]XP_041973829.1 uncharacterized protein LOC121729394 [Aricia agestis]XP_041973830.1 uncharacterized protein LOC121729394 [Aricia agestis]